MICVVVSRGLCALSVVRFVLCVVHFVISDELSIGVCLCPVSPVWLPVSCFMCNVSGLSVVCCAMYCALGCVSAVYMLSVCYVQGRCWLVCVF